MYAPVPIPLLILLCYPLVRNTQMSLLLFVKGLQFIRAGCRTLQSPSSCKKMVPSENWKLKTMIPLKGSSYCGEKEKKIWNNGTIWNWKQRSHWLRGMCMVMCNILFEVKIWNLSASLDTQAPRMSIHMRNVCQHRSCNVC